MDFVARHHVHNKRRESSRIRIETSVFIIFTHKCFYIKEENPVE